MKSAKRFVQPCALVAALVFPALVSAAPIQGSGYWEDCGTDAGTVQYAGPNLIFTGSLVQVFNDDGGPLVGTFNGIERDNVTSTGSATFHGSGSFVGTVAGHEGTYAFSYEGKSAQPHGGPDLDGWDFRATFVMAGNSASGGVTARGTFEGLYGDVPPEIIDPDPTNCNGGGYWGDYKVSVNVKP